MKANKAPEKIYLEREYPNNGVLPNGLNYISKPTDIEYTRTDAFIEKACEYIKEHMFDYRNESKLIEGFRKYMEEE